MQKSAQLEVLLIGETLNLLWSVPYLLSREGFAVDTIAQSRLMRLSKFVRSASDVSSFDELMQAARDRICARAKPYDWVVAADDRTLKALCAIEWPSGMTPQGLPVASGGYPSHIFSKIGLSRTLLAGGIQTPPFRVAQHIEQAVAAAHELGYPVFAKIDASSGGAGVFECRCDSDVQKLKPWLEREPMLMQKKIAGRELDLSAIYADRQLIHFAYSEVKRSCPHFGPSMLRTYYPLTLVGARVFDELAALGQVLDAGGFTTIGCIDAADGSGRYYFEADMRPNAWTDFPRFYGEDAAVRIRNWFSSRTCLTKAGLTRAGLTKENAGAGAISVPVTMPYFLRLPWRELLVNRYHVWRFIPLADTELVLQLLLMRFLHGASRRFLPGKVRKKVKSLLRAVWIQLSF